MEVSIIDRAAFLDISQAFDKVCHDGLYKIKNSFPSDFYAFS